MKNTEDELSSAVEPTEVQDALFDAAQAAILDARDVMVSARTRSAVAALRSEWFGESAPPGLLAEGSTDDIPANIDRLALLGRNVMIGMVQRWLDYLAVPTKDDDALALVRAAIAVTSANEGEVEMPPSPLHLIVASKLPLELSAIPSPVEVATLSTEQLREILRALSPKDLERLARVATAE
jgi:hypothetical protein